MENARFSTVNCAFVDVPPTMPMKNSFVCPAKAETSIEPLLNKMFVSIWLPGNDSTFVPLKAAASESLCQSP